VHFALRDPVSLPRRLRFMFEGRLERRALRQTAAKTADACGRAGRYSSGQEGHAATSASGTVVIAHALQLKTHTSPEHETKRGTRIIVPVSFCSSGYARMLQAPDGGADQRSAWVVSTYITADHRDREKRVGNGPRPERP